MEGRTFISRSVRLASVGSTNDVVRSWLAAGTPEVCLAVADEQTAGRGRAGRSWQAPPGAALLLSLGFRPAWLPPEQAWQLAATVSLAMAEAAERTTPLAGGTIRLKWPNDLVTMEPGTGGAVRKLAGVLGETEGLGSDDPRVVVGIGINAGWPAADFPPELAGSMTSLQAAAGGAGIDRERLLGGFVEALGVRLSGLRRDGFDAPGWAARQATTGRRVTIAWPDGSSEDADATGVDPIGGGLRVRDADGRERSIVVGEVVHLRLASVPAGAGV